jgi:hypothetical protein
MSCQFTPADRTLAGCKLLFIYKASQLHIYAKKKEKKNQTIPTA